MQKQPLFALDIGTRSVVGLVAEPVGDKLNILAFDRQEHQTRAMLDGQIHDVPQVAAVLKTVKDRLEAHVGPLKKVAVAAAGRALLTLRINADLDVATQPVLDRETERTLELAAIQAAQVQLAKQQNLPYQHRQREAAPADANTPLDTLFDQLSQDAFRWLSSQIALLPTARVAANWASRSLRSSARFSTCSRGSRV